VPDADDARRAVREQYRRVAEDEAESCCGDTTDQTGLDLGSGDPLSFADLAPGETVLDLGAGAGGDCLRAAQTVGPDGRAVGVDATPAMVERAREAAQGVENVEFRLGEMAHLPVADGAVDVVVSNCAVNLSPAPARVWREVRRVLRPGGRLAVSDVVRTDGDDGPTAPEARAACVGGALPVERLRRLLVDAGLVDVTVAVVGPVGWADDDGLATARITARAPAAR
jgi:SAM-dependent methyltransferase